MISFEEIRSSLASFVMIFKVLLARKFSNDSFIENTSINKSQFCYINIFFECLHEFLKQFLWNIENVI